MAETVPLLSVDGLSVAYTDADARRPAVRSAYLHIDAGERVGLVGESGSGKSTLALAIMGYLAQGGRITSGAILVNGESLPAGAPQRTTGIAYVPQNPAAALNPLMRIGDQLMEVPRSRGLSPETARDAVHTMLGRVGLTETDRILRAYPHQMSGGQQQRALIAMALLGAPSLLVLDEPTASLDPTVAAAILRLIRDIAANLGTSLLFISHDLRLIRSACERVYVMRAGEIVEEGTRDAIFNAPKDGYTKSLIAAAALTSDGAVNGQAQMPSRDTEPVLTLQNVSKSFSAPARALRERLRPHMRSQVNAAQDISFTAYPGELTAIVGESGSGKTTLARMILGLERPNAGSIRVHGREVAQTPAAQRAPEMTRAVQMVFQHPDETLNPSWSVGFQIGRALRKLTSAKGRVGANVSALLTRAALDPGLANRKPRALSGGQRQRAAIARAIAGAPAVLIADEATSALDVSVEQEIMDLFVRMRAEDDLAIVMISHDLPLMRRRADRMIVLYRGRIVEEGATKDIFAGPSHPYTEELVKAGLDEDRTSGNKTSEADRHSQAEPAGGCVYHARCKRRIGPVCERQAPPVLTAGRGHTIRCHLPLDALSDD